MEQLWPHLHAALEEHWKQLADALVGLFLLLGTWAVYRAKIALSVAAQERERRDIEREKRRGTQEIERCNATLRLLIEASVREERPSSERSRASGVNDWSLTGTALRESLPPEPIPQSTRQRSDESGLRRVDWSDDEDRTARETPAARGRPPDDESW